MSISAWAVRSKLTNEAQGETVRLREFRRSEALDSARAVIEPRDRRTDFMVKPCSNANDGHCSCSRVQME